MALRKSASREDPQQYVLKKNYKKAVEIYRALIKDSPNDANQHLRLGDCLVNDGQVPAAVAEYKQAATLFAEQGFLLKAIGVNKKIVKLDPSQEDVHKNLSELYEERGLLAPQEAAVAAPAPVGSLQFDLEAAGDGELDLELGSGESMPAADLTSGELSADDLAAPDLVAILGDDEVSADDLMALDALGASAAQGVADAGNSAPPADLADDISVDDLDAALADIPGFGTGEDQAVPSEEVAEQDDAESVRRSPFFSDLTAVEFVEVVKMMDQITLAPDEVVVREGETGDKMYVIVSGSVRVVTKAGGKEIKLADLDEGQFFGEGALLTGKPRTATIHANEETELLSLSKPDLQELLATHPRVKDVLLQFFQQRAESTIRAILKSKK